MTVTPHDCIPLLPFLTGTLGQAEIEHAAVLVVLYHLHESPGDWIPVSLETLFQHLQSSDVPLTQKLNHNPFFHPDFRGLVIAGLGEGWDTSSSYGRFTGQALAKLEEALARFARGKAVP